jgi:hypothetical protein
MKKTMVFLAAFVAGLSVLADAVPQTADKNAPAAKKPLKVLMVGNSFSVCVLKQMPQIARDCGFALDLASAYIGGCSLERHVNELAKAESDPTVKAHSFSWNYVSDDAHLKRLLPKSRRISLPAALKADVWDIVTIQQVSTGSWRAESFDPWADRLVAKIREYAPQARIVVQQTWSYCNRDWRICDKKSGIGPGVWGIDQKEMYERLARNYANLAERYGFDVIPTGKAIQLYRTEVTDQALDPVGYPNKKGGYDTIHLNPRGECLQALVWTARLFGANVEKLAHSNDYSASADDFRVMQRVAMMAVR